MTHLHIKRISFANAERPRKRPYLLCPYGFVFSDQIEDWCGSSKGSIRRIREIEARKEGKTKTIN